MTQAIIELPYFPSIEFCSILKSYDEVTLEKWEKFQKQSHRNRTYILGANNLEILTIPIKKSEKHKLIHEVLLPKDRIWATKHLRSIYTAYRSAVYFEYYWDSIEEILNCDYKYLWELNQRIVTFCLKSLGLNVKVSDSFQYDLVHESKVDFRNLLNKGQQHVNRDLVMFEPYEQVFGKQFVSNLSLIDLLFNMGPESFYYINSINKNK